MFSLYTYNIFQFDISLCISVWIVQESVFLGVYICVYVYVLTKNERKRDTENDGEKEVVKEIRKERRNVFSQHDIYN